MSVYWISYSSKAAGCLGVVMVDGESQDDALTRVAELKLEPSGVEDTLVVRMRESEETAREIERWGKDKLISRDELVAAGYHTIQEMSGLL